MLPETSTIRRHIVRFALVLAVLGGACTVARPAAADDYSFYEVSDAELAGAPGSIIRKEDFRGAPWGMSAYRVLYRSTGLDGEPIAVSAVVLVPTRQAPAEGWPVVAWAHPTTGVARKCAPSLALDGMWDTVAGLKELAAKDYIIVATDYPGLGTAGVHPYLVGISEGRAVLDSVRAARNLASASKQYAVWGHSQGGHAVLWAGQLAKDYAPELDLVGIAAAAPASELAKLLDDDLGRSSGQVLTALSIWSWSQVFDAKMASIVLPDAVKPVGEIGSQCLSGFVDLVVDVSAYATLENGFLKGDPTTIAPWSGFLTESTPAREKVVWPPVFLAQGTDDTIVDPPVTMNFALTLCKQGTDLTFHSVEGATHDNIAFVSAAKAVDWIAERFAGTLPQTDCVAKNGASH